jgi:pyruvate/2-oxoglutarate dehydrogenase complex dihydrolipoamide dehydrogenase (E3) component
MSDLLTPDLCIVGDSAGGLRAALVAAAFGLPTILVRTGARDEQRAARLDALRAATALLTQTRDAASFGIEATGVRVDFAAVMRRVTRHEAHLARRAQDARFRALGIQVVTADPTFETTRMLRAGEHRIAARRFILAPDTESDLTLCEGAADEGVWTPETLDRMSTLPSSLAVIGDTAEAIAYAQIFRRFGCAVNLIAAGRLLPHEDDEQGAIIAAALERDGVQHVDTKPLGIASREGGQFRIGLASGGIVEAEAVLVMTRSHHGLDRLGLARAGIGVGPRGIQVDHRLRTNNRAVFALGRLAANTFEGQDLAASRTQADLAMRQILFRWPCRYDPLCVPRVVATMPELAAVGLTEEQARARHGAVCVLRHAFGDNDRALATGQTEGHVKILLDRRGRLIGASLTGPHAADLIGPWGSMLGHRPNDIRNAVVPAPSLAETPRRALQDAYAPLARNKGIRLLSSILRRFG